MPCMATGQSNPFRDKNMCRTHTGWSDCWHLVVGLDVPILGKVLREAQRSAGPGLDGHLEEYRPRETKK